MKSFWNERYSQEKYAYGIAPNQFFKEQLLLLPVGKILLPAEGEGRNAVFAAKLGWDVVAFDNSLEAIKKAEKLADKKEVSISYKLDTFESINLENDSFDAIAFIYAHTPNRKMHYQKLVNYLKSDGMVILEGFSENQIGKKSGGPKKIEMLFSTQKIDDDFSVLKEKKSWQEEITLQEGEFHVGEASVIRFLGKK